MNVRRKQRGFALIGAIFLLVVLAALGAYAVRINMMQRQDALLELQEQRALAALNSGIEYAGARLLASTGSNNCTSLATLANVGGAFTVTFSNCQYLQPQPVVNGVAQNIHTVNVSASSGAYGNPEYVSRQAVGVRFVR